MSFMETGRAPTKAEQDAEAAARRGNAPLDEAGNLEATPIGGPEDTRPEIEDRRAPAEPGHPEEQHTETPRIMSPGDEARARIAEAARQRRQKSHDYDHDATSVKNFFGTLLDQPKAEEPAAEFDPVAPEPGVPEHTVEPAQPRKFRLGEQELTEEQLFDLARKGLQGDQYVNEAKDLLDRTRAAVRPATPEGDQPAHQAEPEAGEPESIDYRDLAERLQLGDLDEAAESLKQLHGVNRPVDPEKVVEAVLLKERFRADSTKAARDFVNFQQNPANKDLLSDEDAFAAIERRVLRKYREELTSIGLADEQIARDPVKLADQHRYFRVNGFQVRHNIDVLNEATKEYRERFATQRAAPSPPPVREGAPRVDVDRSARRQNLPTQPSRSAAPQPALAPQQDGMSRQARLVQAARKARGFAGA